MPINLSNLGGQPDDVAPDGTELGQSGGANQADEKPKRRTKAQLIADAVVPGMDDKVTVKDKASGTKIERPWRVAVELFREDKVEWPTSELKYAFLKYEQQRAAGAFGQASDGPASQEPMGAADTGEPSAQTPSPQHLESGKKGDDNVPPDAEVGDEVVIGAETYRVGHGRVLTHGLIGNPDGSLIHAKRRWQRELGTGGKGPWESTPLASVEEQPKQEQPLNEIADAVLGSSNGNGAPPQVETQRLPVDVERVDLLTWKIGTGILNKIGLPDYSQLQIGPINVSRMVLDDGRRTTVMLGDRKAEIPTAVVEGFQVVTDTVEYVARYQRGELVSFLESIGALTQPVSS